MRLVSQWDTDANRMMHIMPTVHGDFVEQRPVEFDERARWQRGGQVGPAPEDRDPVVAVAVNVLR
jgi:hypothetical protein